MKCPKCGSESCFPISKTEMKGYGLGEGCCGYIIFGPIGLICGLCGMGEGKKTDYWKCGSCGCKFE
jgi:hypothetical protein